MLISEPPTTIHTLDVVGTEDEARQLTAGLVDRLRSASFIKEVRYDEEQGSWVCSLADGGRGRLTLAAPADLAAVAHGTHRIVASCERGSRASAALFFEAARHVPFTDTEMRAVYGELPLTGSLTDSWRDKPLAGHGVILTIHHMRDFLVLVDGLLGLGVDPAHMTVIDKEYPYAHARRVDAHLVHRHGIEVWRYRDLRAGIESHVERVEAAGLRSIAMDDGGYVLPTVLNDLPGLAGHFVGLVEQTTSGIRKLDGLNLPLPLFSVAESDMKGWIESYGIADTAVRNMLRLLPDEKFEGQAALVLGFGRIGSEVARVLRDRRMRVAVYDADITRLVGAHEQGFLTARSLDDLVAVHQPKLVVGCAGARSFGLQQARLLPPRSVLVSTTSRDYEFGLNELRAGSSRVTDRGVLGTGYLLADGPEILALGHGMPINFHHAESLSNRYVDLVLAGLAVGAVALAQGDQRLQPGHNLAATNALLAESGIIDDYYRLYGPTAARTAGAGHG
ncbi:NAD(P)-dependent oxidoreductase [Streptomyces sp. NPDC054835]|uniref:NAD(P)-dependent oxidoreductase n=1 Tax=Streptomyces exfoliatus TaxID=1905 RepID=UPI000463AF8D|nr:NAD(P)-dependent oxidoreductase [Streptomyces exfoliatus]